MCLPCARPGRAWQRQAMLTEVRRVPFKSQSSPPCGTTFPTVFCFTALMVSYPGTQIVSSASGKVRKSEGLPAEPVDGYRNPVQPTRSGTGRRGHTEPDAGSPVCYQRTAQQQSPHMASRPQAEPSSLLFPLTRGSTQQQKHTLSASPSSSVTLCDLQKEAEQSCFG